MKADLAIYTHVLGVPGQYESVALMISHKMDFNCCANRDGFHTDSHIYWFIAFRIKVVVKRFTHAINCFINTAETKPYILLNCRYSVNSRGSW